MEKEIEILESIDCGDDIELKQALEHLIQAYKEQQAEMKKKDKIIDEMAEMLVRVPNNADSPLTAAAVAMINRDLELKKISVKQYFERKIENDIK